MQSNNLLESSMLPHFPYTLSIEFDKFISDINPYKIAQPCKHCTVASSETPSSKLNMVTLLGGIPWRRIPSNRKRASGT